MEIINRLPFTFYGSEFESYYCDDGRFYLPLTKICEAIGLNLSGQRQRIQRDEAIQDDLVQLSVTNIDENNRELVNKTACLWLNRLPYWLGTIDTSRVNEDIKPRLILYKKEFADAAWAVFRSDLVPPDILAEIDTYASPEEQKYHKMMDAARELRKEIDELKGTINRLESRFGIIEERHMAGSYLNNHQQKRISDMVHETAGMIVKKKPVEYSYGKAIAIVWSDLCRAMDVTSYKEIYASNYGKAIGFLQARWRNRFPDDPIPQMFNAEDILELWTSDRDPTDRS